MYAARNFDTSLSDPIVKDSWMVTSNAIEAVRNAFDENFWGSAYASAAPGTAMNGPARPAGVTSWGLRTAWCFWIDNYLANIESNIGSWLTTGKTNHVAPIRELAANPEAFGTIRTVIQQRHQLWVTNSSYLSDSVRNKIT
ncbi:hypothetical protein AnigIFM60653_000867 [Aspergillus niger]|nr:hypothetical protein AnigIFM60653_000867 [Aspergillus niger]